MVLHSLSPVYHVQLPVIPCYNNLVDDLKDNKQMTKGTYNFDNYENDTLTRPRDLAWSNWAKFEKEGDKVQGFIRDAFYRPAEGLYKAHRGITIEQANGELINVGIKRLSFVLPHTDNLRIGDPLTVVLEKLKPAKEKGLSPTKIFAFYGKNLPENAENPTVAELDDESDAPRERMIDEIPGPADDEIPFSDGDAAN